MCIYHLSLYQFWRLKHSVTRYVTPHILWGASPYKQVSFLNACSICMSCCFVYIILHVPPQPVLRFSVSSMSVTGYWLHIYEWRERTKRISHKQSFNFSTAPTICYELWFVVHHYACTTSACTNFSVSSIVLLGMILTHAYYVGHSVHLV
jgi:hypothetical protein